MTLQTKDFINYFAFLRTSCLSISYKKNARLLAWHRIELAENESPQTYVLKSADLYIADVILIRKKDHDVFFIQLPVLVVLVGYRKDIL